MGEVNDGNGYDEDLAKLEAARAALTAELNGEQEDHYVGHQGDGNLQQLAQLQEVSYSLAEAKQAILIYVLMYEGVFRNVMKIVLQH